MPSFSLQTDLPLLKKLLFCFFLLLFVAPAAFGQLKDRKAVFVDSLLSTMDLDQKLGQLFMVRAFSRKDEIEDRRIFEMIRKYKIGGVCFFQGSPKRQRELTTLFQDSSHIPLFIGIDGEWGLGMRFPQSVMKFPRQLTLGAISNDELIYQMGREIATQCKQLGIHMTFAPVIDLNNNFRNPVINERAFGEKTDLVSAKAIAYMRGLKDGGLLATAKHFPGHGDVETDSHKELPMVPHSWLHLHASELVPFKNLINEGIASIMVGHLSVPALDNRPYRAATTSRAVVTGLLKEELCYEGLVLSDAMDMKGVTTHFEPGIAEAEAFAAGIDLLLLPKDIEVAIGALKTYIDTGFVSIDRLDESVRKILNAKWDYGVFAEANIQPPSPSALVINTPASSALKSKMVEAAITLARDDEGFLPLKSVSTQKRMCISIGAGSENDFQKRLSDFGRFSHFQISSALPEKEKLRLFTSATQFDLVVVGLHGMSRQTKRSFGITPELVSFLRDLSVTTKVVLCVFGNPYALRFFDDMPCVVVSYEDDAVFQDITAQKLFGVSGFEGRLPVSASTRFGVGAGIQTASSGILGYDAPEKLGFNSIVLFGVDSLARELISKGVAPGCEILVAKDNRIVYHKSFGLFSKEINLPLKNGAVYDVASMTKVLAGTLGIMKLYDDQKLSLEGTLGRYLPEAAGTNKEQLRLDKVLIHQARLQPSLSFYQQTLEKEAGGRKVPSQKWYSKQRRPGFSTPVAASLFLKDEFKDSLWAQLLNSPLRANDDYRYSDVGFYFVKKIVENQSGLAFEKFLSENYYDALGLKKTLFNPLEKIPVEEIMPSEKDDYWRHQIVRGTVHDMGAALMGGVSGHAGLFTTAKETAVLMQMLLNGGMYDGKKFLSPQTVSLFTKRYNNSSRRGLGFDMKELNPNKSKSMGDLASDQTFGHTGFTGTCVWADPKYNLIYIFLSNRTYPNGERNLLHKFRYREKIQDQIYRSLSQ